MVNFSIYKLSPFTVLVLFSIINGLIYLDRGAFAAVVPILQSDSHGGLNLSSFIAGTLGSSFILGYMVTAPGFAHYAQFYHPEFLMCIGLGIWTCAVIMTGLSRVYEMLLIARCLTGVGEASFICLAPPVILGSAPVGKGNLWIGIFYVATVLGYALGFVYGAQVSNLFGAWFYPFFIEAIAMLPFILLFLFNYKDPNLYAKSETGDKLKLTKQFKLLAQNPVFVFLTLGYAAYTFTITAISFWVTFI